MLQGNVGTIIVTILVVGGLESWRRALRGTAPRWIHTTAIVLSIEIVLGVVIAMYRLRQVVDSLESEHASNRATMLSDGIGRAMQANAIAVGGVLLALIVLTTGSILARRRRTDAPPVAIVRD